MNNQDILYNISLNERETDDVMNALIDKANLLSSLQKKIYSQAIRQKEAFNQYLQEEMERAENVAQLQEEPTEIVEKPISTKKGRKNG